TVADPGARVVMDDPQVHLGFTAYRANRLATRLEPGPHHIVTALVLTHGSRELPPRVHAPQAPGCRIAPGHPPRTVETCTAKPETPREHAVDESGTEASFGGRQRAKADYGAETRGITDQRNQKRWEQRPRLIPICAQPCLADSVRQKQKDRTPSQYARY